MKILLVDDHPLMLSALGTVLASLGPDIEVVGARSADAARQSLAADVGFDLALLDLHLGDDDGFELLAELRTSHPTLALVVVSASDRRADVMKAIGMGAMGFVPKSADRDTLAQALQQVMGGGIYVPPALMRGRAGSPANRDGRPAPVPADGPLGSTLKTRVPLSSLGLTPRQTEVLALLLQGQPNKVIARGLNLSVETVKDHVAAVLRTLNVSSRTQAVLAVSEMAHRGALAERHEARWS